VTVWNSLLWVMIFLCMNSCFSSETKEVVKPFELESLQTTDAGPQNIKSVWLDEDSLGYEEYSPKDKMGSGVLVTQFCSDSIVAKYLKKHFHSNSKNRSMSSSKKVKNKIARVMRVLNKEDFLDSGSGVPKTVHHSIEKWVDFYQNEGKYSMLKYLYRSGDFSNGLFKVFRELGMPKSFLLVALIESGFNHHARSHASAVGPWQFMKPTAQHYGLKVDFWVDERKNPEKSTRAALQYLLDLYKSNDNWYLALAAYNAGPGTIRKAKRKLDTEDFWDMLSSRYIRPETKNYIPKFLAVSGIFEDMPSYGFYANFKKKESVESVDLKHSVSLKQLAKKLEVHPKTIKKWNPEFERGVIAVTSQKNSQEEPAQIQLPSQLISKAQKVIPKLDKVTYSPVSFYSVKKGDTIYGISRRFKIKRSSIKRLNPHLKLSKLRIGKRIALPLPRVTM